MNGLFAKRFLDSFFFYVRMQIMLAHPVECVQGFKILHNHQEATMTHFFCNLWITDFKLVKIGLEEIEKL